MRTSFTVLLSSLICLTSFAQVNQDQALFKSLKTKDSLLFDVGFNTCDLEQFEDLISQDFEFYRDEAGITDSNIKDNICQLSYKPKRRLIEGSLEVHALEKMAHSMEPSNQDNMSFMRLRRTIQSILQVLPSSFMFGC